MRSHTVTTTAKPLIRSLGPYGANEAGLPVLSALVVLAENGKKLGGNLIMSTYNTSAYRTRKPTLSAPHGLSDRIRFLAMVITKYQVKTRGGSGL